MRLGLLIRDAEYRDALALKLSSYDKDLFVNVMDGSTKETAGSLILTDIRPSEIDPEVLKAIKARTVFIVDPKRDDLEGCHTVFKYESISNLISELTLVYNEWHGAGPGRNYSARIITVCCETDAYSASKCLSLARQMIYRHGGKVLILPLSYINDYGVRESDRNVISRLLYTIHTGRDHSSDCFTYTDSYGVSSLMLAPGRNPVAYLDRDDLRSLVSGLAARFDTVICDAGTCFRNENILLMNESEQIVCFETGRRTLGLDELIGKETAGKLIRIKLTGGADEAIAIDDCIKHIFSNGNNDRTESSSDQ